jgi:threonine/homoserine/homoserine lactone efflux protein
MYTKEAKNREGHPVLVVTWVNINVVGVGDVIFYIGIIVGAILSVPVGPIGMLCLYRTVQYGKWSGLASVLGAAASDSIYAYLGTEIVSLLIHGKHAQVVGVCSSLTLVVIGFIFILSLKRNPDRIILVAPNWLTSLLLTFALSLCNPTTGVTFVSILTITHVTARSLWFCSGVFIGSSAWWFVFVNGARFLQSSRIIMGRVCGAIMMLSGFFTLFKVV